MPTGEAGSGPRPPRQQRSREAWQRILDAGVSVLQDRGLPGLTIAAVCEVAGVAPTAIYARIGSKDQLLIAVYEHGMQRVRAAESELERAWSGQADVDAAVRGVARLLTQHADFLRQVVLISATNPEIAHRGAVYARQLREIFVRAAGGGSPAAHQRVKIDAAFTALFATMTMRLAFGADFAGLDADTLVDELDAMIVAYLA